MSIESMNMQQVAAAQAVVPPHQWLARLADECELTRDAALEGAAALLDYPVLAVAELERLQPMFNVADYGDMVRRCALVAEDGAGRRVAVLGLPQQAGLGAWLATLDLAELF